MRPKLRIFAYDIETTKARLKFPDGVALATFAALARTLYRHKATPGPAIAAAGALKSSPGAGGRRRSA